MPPPPPDHPNRLRARLQQAQAARASLASDAEAARRRIDSLRGELAAAQVEREALERAVQARLRGFGKSAARTAKVGSYFFLGPRLARSLRNLANSWRPDRKKLPADAVVDAADALVIRVVGRKRLALMLAVAALIPASISIPFFYQQNQLLEEKNEDLEFYANAQMRARLMEILYQESDGELDAGGRARAAFNPALRALAVETLIPIERARIPKKRAFLTEHIPAFAQDPEAAAMFLDLVSLYSVRLGYAQFEDADLAGLALGVADLRFCRFTGCDLRGTVASSSSVFGSKFVRCDLRDAHFDSTLSGAVTFEDSQMQGANLDEAQMGTSVFRRCDLSGASAINTSFLVVTFADCSLADADLSGADLRGADLSSCDLSGAKLAGAYYNRSTKFPVGFAPGAREMIEGKPPGVVDPPGLIMPEPSAEPEEPGETDEPAPPDAGAPCPN